MTAKILILAFLFAFVTLAAFILIRAALNRPRYDDSTLVIGDVPPIVISDDADYQPAIVAPVALRTPGGQFAKGSPPIAPRGKGGKFVKKDAALA